MRHWAATLARGEQAPRVSSPPAMPMSTPALNESPAPRVSTKWGPGTT